MPRIQINEIDNTRAGFAEATNEVVYIPGFVALALDGTNGKEVLQPGEARLFTSISEFEAACGTEPQKLILNTYGDIVEVLGETELKIADKTTTLNIELDKLGVESETVFSDVDMSYIYAKECLASGLAVLYENIYPTGAHQVSIVDGKISDSGISAKRAYEFICKELFNIENQKYNLLDKGTYNIKYMTTGGYPIFDIMSVETEEDANDSKRAVVEAALKFCATRGDCYCVLDYFNIPGVNLYDGKGSIFADIQDEDIFKNIDIAIEGNKVKLGTYGALFAPYKNYFRTTVDTDATGEITSNSTYTKSGSFAYLTTLGESVKNNAPWLAVAGVTRGTVKNIDSVDINIIPNGAADAMQGRYETVGINAITKVNPYGEVIWGNRTLLKTDSKDKVDGISASNILSIRNLICDIKKELYKAAKRLTYEPNTTLLWTKFKGLVTPLLDKMQSGYGISGYNLIQDTTRKEASQKGVLCAKVIIYPVYPVEDFYIDVVIENEEITIV